MDPVAYGLYLVDFFKVGVAAGGNGLIQLPPNWPAAPTKPKATYFGGGGDARSRSGPAWTCF